MKWHYIDNGQQRGPVSEQDLATLAMQGTITGDTMVWSDGMADWRPYREVTGQAAPGATAPPAAGQVVCCECQRSFAPDDVIRHGNVYVCASCKPVFLQKLREGVAPVGVMDYAGFWIRAGAKVLDSIILVIPTQLINLVLVPLAGRPIAGQPPKLGVGPLLVLAVDLGIMLGYYTFMVGKYGATLGKMAAKLKILNADGSPVSYGKAAGRYFAELLSAMICYIGYIMVGFDAEKRALHDRICNTRVIRTKKV